MVGCFYPPTPTQQTTTTAGIATSTAAATTPLTTTTLQPTTTTMNYCTQEQGMNQPLTIDSKQVTYKQPPVDTTSPRDINPTLTNPGLTYATEPSPTINVTLDQPATLTLIYVPIDRPNQPSNVNQFNVAFVFPNNTTPIQFTSSVAGTVETTTTTTPSGLPSSTSTTPGTTPGVQPPSSVSPTVDLPANFQVPEGTVIIITVLSTINYAPPTGVRIILVLPFFYLFETLY
jgi:hypothetical protein